MIDLMQRRREMMGSGGNPLPYDAEIEWLYSDGSAYIDTGIEATGDLFVECEFKIENNTNAAIAGAILNVGGTYNRAHLSPTGTQVYWYKDSFLTTTVTINNASFYHFTLDTINGTYSVNNTIVSFSVRDFTCNCNYGIFARLSSNMAIQSKPSYFKWFKMARNETLLRDFIPVRIGQVGYMYDRVSGELFGNAGTGDFVLGNDKN